MIQGLGLESLTSLQLTSSVSINQSRDSRSLGALVKTLSGRCSSFHRPGSRPDARPALYGPVAFYAVARLAMSCHTCDRTSGMTRSTALDSGVPVAKEAPSMP